MRHVIRNERVRGRLCAGALLGVVLSATAFAAEVQVTLTPSLPSGQPVGTAIAWNATADRPVGFRYEARLDGGNWRQIKVWIWLKFLPRRFPLCVK